MLAIELASCCIDHWNSATIKGKVSSQRLCYMAGPSFNPHNHMPCVSVYYWSLDLHSISISQKGKTRKFFQFFNWIQECLQPLPVWSRTVQSRELFGSGKYIWQYSQEIQNSGYIRSCLVNQHWVWDKIRLWRMIHPHSHSIPTSSNTSVMSYESLIFEGFVGFLLSNISSLLEFRRCNST